MTYRSRCRSGRVETSGYAKKAGCTIGTMAGAAGGAGAAVGAEVGANSN